MDSLRNKGLIRVIGGDGGPERVVITSEGMAAIGVEREGEDEPTGNEADVLSPGTTPASAEADKTAQTPGGCPGRLRRGHAGQEPAGQGQEGHHYRSGRQRARNSARR
jgi:hypothetical protein